MYPKATSPINFVSYHAANQRADRWMRRYYEAVKTIETLESELFELDKAK